MQGHHQASQHPDAQAPPITSSSSAAASGQRQQAGEQDQQGAWGRPDEGLLPLVASWLQQGDASRDEDVASARLVCRQWAAELPQGCTKLRVTGKGPPGWERRFRGVQSIVWVRPEVDDAIEADEHSSWRGLRSLHLQDCRNQDRRMLRDAPSLTSFSIWGFDCPNEITDQGLRELRRLPALSSLHLVGCKSITDKGLKELTHNNNASLTSLSVAGNAKITDAGPQGARCRRPGLPHLPQPHPVREHHGPRGPPPHSFPRVPQPPRLLQHHGRGPHGAQAHPRP